MALSVDSGYPECIEGINPAEAKYRVELDIARSRESAIEGSAERLR